MTFVEEEDLFSVRILHQHPSIATGQSKPLAIRRPRHAGHKFSMPTVCEQGLSAAGIPHLHGFISACGGNAFAIGRPRYAPYRSGMAPPVNARDLPGADIPHLYSPITTGCGKSLPIG